MIWRRKVKSQDQSIDFDQTLTFYKIREEKEDTILENFYLKTREKMENFDIRFVIFTQELDLLWFIENQWSEKSWNEHFSRNTKID